MATNQPCNQVSGCFYYCRRFLGDELVFTPVCSSRLCFRELCRQRFDRWEGYVCCVTRAVAVLQQTCQRYFPSMLSSRKVAASRYSRVGAIAGCLSVIT